MDTTEPRTAATLASHICDGESHRSKSKYQLDAKIDMTYWTRIETCVVNETAVNVMGEYMGHIGNSNVLLTEATFWRCTIGGSPRLDDHSSQCR